MCVYCMVGDKFFEDQHPPVWPLPVVAPYVPLPNPLPDPNYTGWPIDKLKDLLDILQRIKILEDSLKCPCIPAKADYIQILKDRIRILEDGLEICASCKRWYGKPAADNHTRVQCLEIQLADAKAEEGKAPFESIKLT